MDNISLKTICITWDGPLDQNKVIESNTGTDYGVYMVYGDHDIYGENTLLYIGKAEDQTFAIRLPQHAEWFYWQDINLKFYLGRFCGLKPTSNEDWSQQIQYAESALISYCCPSWNSKGINSNKTMNHFENAVIFNFGQKRQLPYSICYLSQNYYHNVLPYNNRMHEQNAW